MMSKYGMTIEGTTVRYWDVFRQQWQEAEAADLAENDRIMATLLEADRERVREAARR